MREGALGSFFRRIMLRIRRFFKLRKKKKKELELKNEKKLKIEKVQKKKKEEEIITRMRISKSLTTAKGKPDNISNLNNTKKSEDKSEKKGLYTSLRQSLKTSNNALKTALKKGFDPGNKSDNNNLKKEDKCVNLCNKIDSNLKTDLLNKQILKLIDKLKEKMTLLNLKLDLLAEDCVKNKDNDVLLVKLCEIEKAIEECFELYFNIKEGKFSKIKELKKYCDTIKETGLKKYEYFTDLSFYNDLIMLEIEMERLEKKIIFKKYVETKNLETEKTIDIDNPDEIETKKAIDIKNPNEFDTKTGSFIDNDGKSFLIGKEQKSKKEEFENYTACIEEVIILENKNEDPYEELVCKEIAVSKDVIKGSVVKKIKELTKLQKQIEKTNIKKIKIGNYSTSVSKMIIEKIKGSLLITSSIPVAMIGMNLPTFVLSMYMVNKGIKKLRPKIKQKSYGKRLKEEQIEKQMLENSNSFKSADYFIGKSLFELNQLNRDLEEIYEDDEQLKEYQEQLNILESELLEQKNKIKMAELELRNITKKILTINNK